MEKSNMYYNEFQQLTVKHFICWAKKIHPNIVFYSGPNSNGRYVHLKTSLSFNLLDPTWINRIPKFHPEAYKLTSSQIMCLNFFEPLLGSNAYDSQMLLHVFLDEIQQQLNSFSSGLNANDELESYGYERNFLSSSIDLYIRTKEKYEYFCEIKYTEKEFGSFGGKKSDSQTYYDKMLEVFNSKFKDSYIERQNFTKQKNNVTYLEDFFGIENSINETKKKLDFNGQNLQYSNYQINRNVILANSDKKFTVFIYPFIREDITLELENYKEQKNVVLIDWKNLSQRFYESGIYSIHYKEFHNKYIWW